MGKKITRRLVLTGIVSMVVTLVLCVYVFYAVFEKQAEKDLRIYAGVIAATYYQIPDNWTIQEYKDQDLRVTLIRPDGRVLFDNTVSGEIENHLDRPEVQQAMETGEGADERRSTTTTRTSYYYAMRLEDGNVLRVSMDVNSWSDLFRSAIPVILICCILIVAASIWISLLLTKSLVNPIVQMGSRLDEIDREIPYPELQPFVDAIVQDRTIRQENENMRQEFTANVSHELKTPLTSISGYAELIETGIAKPEDVQNFAQKIHKESGRLLHLVNDILQLSRLDTEEKVNLEQMDLELLDLKDIVATCADNLAVNAQRAYVTLLYEGEHAQIMGNRSHIDDLCVNLCDNAIRYNKPGGKVVMSCGMVDGRPYLRVRDDGIGIPEEDQKRVFERFYRVDKSRSKETGGTGLGLAIVKHIAMIHGAQIELKSQVGIGTDIRVLFKPAKK